MVVRLVLQNCVDAGEKSSDVEEAGGGHHLGVGLDHALQGSKDVEDGEVRVANALGKTYLQIIA